MLCIGKLTKSLGASEVMDIGGELTYIFSIV